MIGTNCILIDSSKCVDIFLTIDCLLICVTQCTFWYTCQTWINTITAFSIEIIFGCTLHFIPTDVDTILHIRHATDHRICQAINCACRLISTYWVSWNSSYCISISTAAFRRLICIIQGISWTLPKTCIFSITAFSIDVILWCTFYFVPWDFYTIRCILRFCQSYLCQIHNTLIGRFFWFLQRCTSWCRRLFL